MDMLDTNPLSDVRRICPRKGEPGFDEYRTEIRARRKHKRELRINGLVTKAIEKIEREGKIDWKFYGSIGREAKNRMWNAFAAYMLTNGIDLYRTSLEKIDIPKDQCAEIRKMMEFHRPKLSAIAFADFDTASTIPVPSAEQRARLKQLL